MCFSRPLRVLWELPAHDSHETEIANLHRDSSHRWMKQGAQTKAFLFDNYFSCPISPLQPASRTFGGGRDMNAARLRELVDLLVDVESRFDVQSILNQMFNELNQITSSPGQPQFQTQFSQSLGKFRTSWQQMIEAFSPAQAKLLNEIGAGRFFLDDIPAEIEEETKDNNITPAVIRDKVQSIQSTREQYLTTIRELRDRLKSIGIEAYQLEPGTAEIGLLLPRDLFHNELSGLVKELHTLNRIIRAFSEIAVGKAEPVEIHQISTSDPVFFFGVDPATIALLGGAITWAIQSWKSVEDIRRVRAETQKLKSFTSDEVEDIFGKKIQKEIAIAVDQKVGELIPSADGAGRWNEQRNDMKWALESILGRVERGMTVEIRFLPPPDPKEGELEVHKPTTFDTLKEVAPQLRFPASDPSAVLTLPPATPPSEQPLKP